MKILIVEDKRETILGILDYCDDNDLKYKIIDDFDSVLEELESQQYDLLVLDLKKDPTETYPGIDIFNEIWEKRFIPVIVYSTYYQHMQIQEHPFVKYFEKDQEEKVKETIGEFSGKIQVVKELKTAMNKLFLDGLRAYKYEEDPNVSLQRIILYMKNLLENQENHDIFLPADVQLIDLPTYSGLITCDILESIPISGELSERYMILSPWCDIYNNDDVIIECKPLVKYDDLKDGLKKSVKDNKNNGGADGYILLPDNDKFVGLVVDCRNTKLISKKDISLNSKENDISEYKYRKIFSIASPYRERMIELCYSNRSRIGVPNLDKDSWWR